MDNIDQLLKDFYDKYGQQPLDNTKLQTIKSTYGNNYDQLLTDLYSKYNQPLDNNKLKLIKDTYKLETPIANTVQPDILNEYIGFLESNGRYDAKNDVYLPKLGRTSKATGKYQHIWDLHKDDIIKTTGIKDRSTYLKTPEAQEAYQQVLNTQYQQALPEYIKIAQNRGLQLDEKELIYIMHHEGVDGGKQFLETGVSKFGSEKAINNRLKAGRRWMEKNGLSIGSLTTNTSDQTNQMESIPNTSLTELINNEAVKLANKKNKEKLGSMSYLDKMAYDWNRRSIIGDIMDGNGYGMNKATKSEIEAAKIELLQSGKYGKFKSAEELAAVLDPNYKENIEKANAAGDKVQKSLEDDFNTDAGLFDTSPFGDNRGYRRDGRTGQKQADIIPNFWVGDDVGQYWMGVDKIMTLTEHPLITKNPKKYNYKEQKELNQHLRNIQADISKPQQIKREATTGYINNYLQYAGNRIQAIEKEFTTKYGNLQKLSEEAKLKLQQDPLYQEYQELATGYETEYANLESKNATFKLAEANDNLEKLFNKKEDINHKKNYATLGFLEKSLQNVTSFAKDALTAAARMPGDVAVLAGTGVDTVLDTDLGTTRAIASSRNAGKISTTAIKEGAIPLSVKLDTEDEIYAIYNNKNEIERFTDGKYFTITDDPNSETFKRLVQEEKKSLNSGKPSWGFNTDAFLHGVREPMIDMVPLILGGGIAKTIATKAASVVGKTSRVGNALTKVANSDKFLTFAGSYAGFSGKMMDSAIKEGGLVDSGDIFLATTAKVGLEAVIEAYNPMGGRLFTDKLFSSLSKQQVKQLSKIISEEGVFKALPIISRQFRKEIIENGLGESMEEILATIIEPSVVNNILNNTIGTSYDTSFSVKDVAESALVGMASGFAMGGILESGPTALSAINNPSSVIQESLRAALQNKQIFDKIIEENKNVDLQNASDQDVEKVKAKYDNIKKIMDNAAIYSEKVFKEHPDTGHVPSSGMQTLYSNVAFNKARKENKKYDLEEDVNKNIASIDQDTKKLKELDLFIGAGLDFFNGIADTNKEAKIMSDTELKDNYFTVYNDVKDIVAKIGNKKNSDAQKLALIKAETKLALIKAKNKTENKVNPEVITAAEEVVKVETAAAKQEAKELETKEAVIKGTAKPEQVEAELAKAKQSVDDLFTGQKTLKDNELPDFSIDLIQELLENTPDMLKGEVSQYIDKKLEAINAQAYRQQVQNFNQQEKTAKPTNSTKLSPDVAFDTRYGGNTELENAEWSTFKDSYIRELDKEMNVYDSVGDVTGVMNTLDIIKRMETATSFRDAYITDPKFREFVDANTNAIASKPNTLITKEQKQKEADKKAKEETKKEVEKTSDNTPTTSTTTDTDNKKTAQEEKTPVEGGKISVTISDTANGFGALSVADNLLVTDYLKVGDPVFYELSDKSTDTKPVIEKVVYYKDENFGQPGKGTKRIVLQEGFGKDEHKLTERFANEIKAGKERVETKATYVKLNKNTFSTIVLGDINVEENENNVKLYTIKRRFNSYEVLNDKNVSVATTKVPIDFIKDDLKNKLNSGVITKNQYDLYIKSVDESQSPKNRPTLSIEQVKAIKPYLYVVGKSFNSDENIILLDSEKDGENFVSISDFISDLKDKHPDLKNFQEVENILRHDDVNGKVVFVKGNTIIPLDTITNRDYEPNKKFITEFLDRLSSEATGMPDWRIDIDGRFLADAVRKRSDVKDYKNETSPNFRGRLIEYFASGPQHRQENPTELIYKIKYNEEEGKSEPIYLTKEQALEELLSIRVNIDHAELRAENSESLTNLLSDVLRVPATPGKGFTILYNVVGLDNVDGEAVIPNTIKLTSEPAVTPKEKETKNVTTVKELKEDAPIKRGGGKKRDFKISDVDYIGKVEETVKYLKTRFEEIGVEVNDDVLRNLVKGTVAEGAKVWGAFHNAMVTLSSLSGEKIGKHEAMHVAEIMFHTDAQIKAFRQEALSRYGKELGITKTKADDLTDEELTNIREALATEFENYKNTLLLPEGFSKKYPTISKFIEKLFNFLKKNYLIGRSYITNNKSIDQLFYEIENNILGRDFIGRRKKSTGDLFQQAVNKLSEENRPDFKISDWTNEETNKFANFLATDIFTKHLEDVYRNSSVNEILANNKNLSLETIITKFTNSLEKTLDDYKNNVVKREELETSSDEYQILEVTLKDIHKQYASNEANKAFKRIVNKKLGNRYAGIVEFDKLEEDSLTENDENIKEVDDTEIAQAESWQTKQGKIDAKTKSSARLREFFSGIPLRTRLIRDGKSERTTITDEDLFSTQYYSGDYIHNKLLLELSDNSNYEDFIKAVNGLVKKHQFGADIIAAIMNLKEEKLVEAYDNDTLELPLDIFTNLEKHSDYKLWILKDMYYAIGDQSNVQPIKTLTKNKGDQTISTQIGLSVQNTDYDNAVRTIKESIDAILVDSTRRESFKNLLEQTITAITDKGKVAGLIIKVFAEMGYQVSDELLLNLQPTSFMSSEEDNLSYLKKGLNSILNDINESKIIINPETNTGEEIFTKTSIDATGRGVDIPAKLISTYSTVSSGLSYMNVEGENEFAHQNSNHLSRVGAIWAKGKDAMKQWVNNMRYVDGDPNKAIVLQSYLPIYNDMLDSANTFRIYLDGGTQVEGQTNSGKAYADMTFAELTAHSINLYLTKNDLKNAGNTIKKLHALFHVMVFSDSPKREMLHAPTYNGEVGHNRIVDKLADIVYGELERVGYAKAQENTSINELEKLSVAGKLIHTIPQLNDVKIKVNGKYMPFADFFATDSWTNPNSAIQISENTTYKSIDKQGREFELPLKGGTYRGMVSQIIKETLATDYEHFISDLYNSDVRKLVTNSATDDDIKDYYYNSYYYNISAGIMFSGDPAHYKLKNDSTNIERVKRDKQVVAPNIHLAFEKPTYDVIILEDVKANTSNVGNEEVAAELADASAWHTLERRIEILKASPDWELKEAEVLQALEAIQNNEYTQEDLKTVHLQIIKPFVYVQVNKELPVGDGVTAYFKLPIQLKNSEVVLLPTEAYRVYGNSTSYVRPQSLEEITADKYYSPELARTLYLMEKTKVGTVIFESGSKGEIFGKVNLETYTEADIASMSNTSTRATTVLTLKNSDWGLQMEVPRKDLEAKVGQGTQEHKIMSANVDGNWMFTIESTGEVFKGQQGANDLLQRIQETFVKENYDALLKEITNADGDLNTPEVLAIISEALEEKFTNVDIIEGLELQTDGKTLTPLELFGKKAEKVLNSLFKGVSKIKGSGAALVNKTSVGYIRDVEFDKDKGEINLSNDLKLVRDEKGNILYYEAVVPVYNPVIYKFIDNNGELLLDENGKPLIPEKLLYSFFYRIPTEDKYSMFPIKIKKFSMPVEGGGIILPREATQTAGLDFDIDKLYGYYYNFKVDENTNAIKLTEPSLKNSKSAHNLKLDVYFSLVNTEAYTRDALTPGNKDRLTALRNELVGSQYQPKYSYGDPSFIAKSANKNIVGKRLIGIFANGNSFYNLIQGVAKIMLKNPITFTTNGVEYTFDSIGGINHQISKNIAELLFASTEDVKDPVLEPLNINTHTAPLLVTLLSMTNGTEIIKFEDAIKLLSDQSIINAVKKAESEGKKFTNVYSNEGKYYNLVQISEKYNAIVSASKIDQAIGPDFFTVQSKISNIDNIIKDGVKTKNYPFTSDSVKEILPSKLNKSNIKQLNTFREALDKELELFANVFSFLKPKVINTLDILEGRSKTGKLAPDKKYTLAYYMYDAAIQNLYEEEVIQDLIENFPTKLFEYKYPGNTGILKQAFEIDKKGIVKMRWVNTNATNILEQYKEAFSDLFTLDPTMAKELAMYAFLTGTKFKMDSIVKIVPNEFYKKGIGKEIRDIINGNTLEAYLPSDIADIIMLNHYKLILPKEEIQGDSLKNASSGPFKDYVWTDQDKVDVIYKHFDNGIYIKHHTIEKTKFPNYLINVKNNATFVKNNNMDNAINNNNPLILAGVKPTDMYNNAAKDIQMAEESTQFIGFQSGTAAVSSTDKYREAWGDKANTGSYSKNDVIMVSGSGLFRGVTEAQIKEVLTNKYKPLLDQAIAAGASFRVGNQYNKGNLSDQLIAEYLKAKGYVEEYLNGYSRWSSSSNTQSDSPLNGDDITPCTKIK